MKVEDRMVRSVVTIGQSASISDAIKLMKKHSIRHLPVVKGQQFVGWVTAGDIREAFLASVIEQLTVGDVMIKDPLTISPEANLEEAAELLHRHRVGGLPVVVGRRLVGVITVADIMAAFIEVMGILKESSRIDVILGTNPLAFEEVAKIIRDRRCEIMSVGMSAHQDRKDRIYYLRLSKCDVHAMAKKIQEAGYQVVSVTE